MKVIHHIIAVVERYYDIIGWVTYEYSIRVDHAGHLLVGRCMC